MVNFESWLLDWSQLRALLEISSMTATQHVLLNNFASFADCFYLLDINSMGRLKMNSSIFLVPLLFASSNLHAAELPEWVKPAARAAVIGDFFEFMKNRSEFYRVTSVEVIDSTFESGQASTKITVTFDDSKNCSDRKFVGRCTPLQQERALFCFLAATDCMPTSNVNLGSKIH